MSVGVGVVGFGFMGVTHARAYARAGARLVGVCDRNGAAALDRARDAGNIESGGTEIDFGGVAVHEGLGGLLAEPGVDVVSVCTPTDTHVSVAQAAMRAGKHVLVEKPVALTAEAVEGLDAVARSCGVLCMPAMCMRFWPAWAWVADAVRDRRFGAVRSAWFDRAGAMPSWSRDFYGDVSRSGDALFDLHVHDTDFVVHLFGVPDGVESEGSTREVRTAYRYTDGPGSVVAGGGWYEQPGFGFRMRMVVECEGARLDFALGRENELIVSPVGSGAGSGAGSGGASFSPELDARDGWAVEVAAFVGAVADGAAEAPATLASAAASTGVLERELRSLRTGLPA